MMHPEVCRIESEAGWIERLVGSLLKERKRSTPEAVERKTSGWREEWKVIDYDTQRLPEHNRRDSGRQGHDSISLPLI